MLYDKDIREPLFDFFEDLYGKTRVIEEKMMGRSRADIVVVIDGALVGVEIKSDADTYARLTRQVKDYDSYFDYNYVVVGSKHALHIKEHVPEHWGIISVEEAEGGIDFYVLREPGINPNLKMEKKLGILWRIELVNIQEKNAMPKYKEKSKAFVVGKIIERVDVATINRQISEELFERDYTSIAEKIAVFRQNNNKKPRKAKKKSKKYRNM